LLEDNSGMMTRRTFQAGMLSVASGAQLASAAAHESVVLGLDHIILAVADLEGAKADFAALGFALKPGRPHNNGLRNAHAKFPDGTEIELITAPAATDALASDYYNWLKDGDGPAFLGFYAPSFGTLIDRLSRLGLRLNSKGGIGTVSEPGALRRLFFGRRQHSPTDRPEHFALPTPPPGLQGFGWLGPLPSSAYSRIWAHCPSMGRHADRSVPAPQRSCCRRLRSCSFPRAPN
jgi:hypothetical protein